MDAIERFDDWRTRYSLYGLIAAILSTGYTRLFITKRCFDNCLGELAGYEEFLLVKPCVCGTHIVSLPEVLQQYLFYGGLPFAAVIAAGYLHHMFRSPNERRFLHRAAVYGTTAGFVAGMTLVFLFLILTPYSGSRPIAAGLLFLAGHLAGIGISLRLQQGYDDVSRRDAVIAAIAAPYAFYALTGAVLFGATYLFLS
ncbi:MAG: hypothetical protein SVU88_03405 [Candidatus Nanohaloarchaea archaeon]|nr:hypothetical protein [Candidatus Nanohaloarchaea archaeon]